MCRPFFFLIRSISSRKPLLIQSLTFGLLSIVLGCASSDVDDSTPEGAFKLAQQYQEMERYEEALRRYNEVRSKFPHSKHAIEAALALADVYYLQENFKEAEINYKSFRELHSRHPRMDYVVFRVGLSLVGQLPSTNDRDLSTAPEAIEVFESFIKTFPSSEFIASARQNILDLRQRLAAREDYVGSFYLRRGQHSAAIDRFLYLVKNFPESPLVEGALQKALRAARKKGDPRQIEDLESMMRNR
jgi:outer membrane protein assembly factor BamD